jgi:hypothetical protein
MAKNDPAPQHVADAAAEALRAFWNLGRSSWAEVEALPRKPAGRGQRGRKPSGYVHGNKVEVLKAAATKVGVNFDTLAKAWKAADLYDGEEIEELCGLVRKHRARFGPTHLIRALAVRERGKRDRLIRRAIRGRWGVTRLEREIQVINNGPRRHAGRQPDIPDDGPALLASLIALCAKWERFHAEAAESLPAGLAGVVERATRAVLRLRQAAEGELPATEGD